MYTRSNWLPGKDKVKEFNNRISARMIGSDIYGVDIPPCTEIQKIQVEYTETEDHKMGYIDHGINELIKLYRYFSANLHNNL